MGLMKSLSQLKPFIYAAQLSGLALLTRLPKGWHKDFHNRVNAGLTK